MSRKEKKLKQRKTERWKAAEQKRIALVIWAHKITQRNKRLGVQL
jgi:hypothetical protein